MENPFVVYVLDSAVMSLTGRSPIYREKYKGIISFHAGNCFAKQKKKGSIFFTYRNQIMLLV
jgi:hypothetical protein